MDFFRKEPSRPGAAALMAGSTISPQKSMGELVDLHQQLRHEASGLRLQLAAKQVSHEGGPAHGQSDHCSNYCPAHSRRRLAKYLCLHWDAQS